MGLLKPHDRIMGLDLTCGGHLTHGFMTAKKRVSGTSVYYESIPYRVDKYGFIDYDGLELLAEAVRPRLIICGASAYSRDFDYARFHKIAKKHDAYLMADIAHISGFVATQEMANPFGNQSFPSGNVPVTLQVAEPGRRETADYPGAWA